jgi:hypothetical protein
MVQSTTEQEFNHVTINVPNNDLSSVNTVEVTSTVADIISQEFNHVTDYVSNNDLTSLISTETTSTSSDIISQDFKHVSDYVTNNNITSLNSAISNFTTQDTNRLEITAVIKTVHIDRGQPASRRDQHYNSINVLYQVLKIIQLFDK